MINSNNGQLKPTPPFDFSQSLNFLGLFPPTQNEQTLVGQTLIKAICLDGQVIVFQVRSVGSVENPQLAYTLWSDQPLAAQIERAVVDRIGFFLSLADDLRSFYAIGQADPPFAPIIERLYGYHQVKFLTPFENACWAILTQRTPMALARKMKQALTTGYGGSLGVAGTTYWAFPEPASLAAATRDDLAVLLHHARRAEYIGVVAQAFAEVDETFLRTGPYAEVKAWLHGLKGIGSWSADFILIRGLGRMDSPPLTEKRFLESVARVYGREPSFNDKTVEHLAGRYGPWQGYWAHYLRAAESA